MTAAKRVQCDQCERPAAVTVTAAHQACDVAHPHWATYPAPMARLCWAHLPDFAIRDQAAPGATPAYLIRPVNLRVGR